MTSEQKGDTARFLDLAADYLLDGCRRTRDYTGFEDDAPLPAAGASPVFGTAAGLSGETAAGASPVSVDAAAETSPVYGEAAGSSAGLPGEAVAGASPAYGEANPLEELAEEVRRCDACRLREKRARGVPGEGVSTPLVLVVGEAPGAEEDATGRPFVGRAGQLLDKMLASIGLSRQKNCYIANIVKCRPPQNRDPMPDEIVCCGRFLKRQIALLRPKIIFCAGRISAQTMLRTTIGIGKLRGHFEAYRAEDAFDAPDGPSPSPPPASIPLLSTYHPSALLRDESLKRPAWEDLKTLRARLMEIDNNYARETAGQQ